MLYFGQRSVTNMIYFSKGTNGFYHTKINGDNIPEDAVEITEERYRELLDGQSQGKEIGGDDSGSPELQDGPGREFE